MASFRPIWSLTRPIYNSSSSFFRRSSGTWTTEEERVYGNRMSIVQKRPELFREKPLTFVKVVVVTVGGIYAGAMAAKGMAHFLEDNDIFAPEDDDDDED